MQKAKLRTLCRSKWGKHWYDCHPVLKKARLTWALQQLEPKQHNQRVTVTESGSTYEV